MTKLQCKDICDVPILRLLASLKTPATLHEGYPHSIHPGLPSEVPPKLLRAKMDSLIRRKLVAGCACGCRGDFTLTDAGRKALLDRQNPASEQVKALQQHQRICYHAVTIAMDNGFERDSPEFLEPQADYDKTVRQLVALLGDDVACSQVDFETHHRFESTCKDAGGLVPKPMSKAYYTRQECLAYLARSAENPI